MNGKTMSHKSFLLRFFSAVSLMILMAIAVDYIPYSFKKTSGSSHSRSSAG